MKYLVGFISLVVVLLGVAALVETRQSPNPSPSVKISPSPSSNTPVSQSLTTVSKGEIPTIPFKLVPGFTIHTFASGLGTARDLQFSPGGTLLVSNPGSGEVYALPDSNKDGVADDKKVVVSNLNHAHGLAFYHGMLYVAATTQVVRYNWDESSLTATKDKGLFSLPANNDHNSRTLAIDQTGKMFISVGSTCNVCNESSDLSATVLTADADGNNLKVFAKGLRNAPFIQFNPTTGELWGTEMGRDNLGDDVPPDEINIIKDGLDYGWPSCYGDKIADKAFNPNAQCQNTQPPIFQIPAHSAPLGLSFINSSQFPSDWQGDLLVSYHGSWNRSTPTGYKVVHMKVQGSTITQAEDFLTGFLPSGALIGPASALGRPVDLTFDSQGNLYLSDDKAGNVYIIQKNQ